MYNELVHLEYEVMIKGVNTYATNKMMMNLRVPIYAVDRAALPATHGPSALASASFVQHRWWGIGWSFI